MALSCLALKPGLLAANPGGRRSHFTPGSGVEIRDLWCAPPVVYWAGALFTPRHTPSSAFLGFSSGQSTPPKTPLQRYTCLPIGRYRLLISHRRGFLSHVVRFFLFVVNACAV